MAKLMIHTNLGWREVDAEPISIPGFESVELFVHPAFIGTAWWTVTEGRTGHLMGEGKTRTKAIQNASKKLCKWGLERVLATIAKTVGKHGLSALYAEREVQELATG